MKAGDMVGYINGNGPIGLVLAVWSEWAETGWEEEEVVQTWVQVLWSDGMIDEHDDQRLEKINESR